MSDYTGTDCKNLSPVGKVTVEEAKAFFKEKTYRSHPQYEYDYAMDRKAELYDACAQWLAPAGMGWGSTRKANWVNTYYEPNDPNYTPTPVFNEGFGARTNESAHLGRPNYRALVEPLPSDGNVTYPMRVNAKNATRAIRSRLKELEWDKIAVQLYYHMPVYGGTWVKSEWVQDWERTIKVPNPEALECSNPTCDFKSATPLVPFKALKEKFGAPQVAESAGPHMGKIGACPQCPDHPPLQPYAMTMEEAINSKDSFGRDMGRTEPMGDWDVSVRIPYDMFPRDLGYSMKPGHVDEWVEVHMEQVDWCYKRFANAKGILELKPESPVELAKYHPNLGTPDIYGSILDNKILRNSVNVMEYHRKPWMEKITDEATGESRLGWNEGRSLITANNVVLLDGPLILKPATKGGKPVARVQMDYIPWELRDGGRRLNGMSLWELLFDPQDARNEITAQTQSVRQRMALPLYAALRSWNLQIGTRNGVPGRFAFFDVDPAAPTFKPEVFNNQTIDAGVDRELQDAIQTVSKFAGHSQVDQGTVPPGVTAALAIQYLKTYASEGREPRLARIREGFKRMYEHGLELMRAFYLEPRKIEFEDEQGTDRADMVDWEALQVDGTVKVDAEADFDDRARNQQLVTDMLQSPLIDTTDPSVRREVARILELPEELFKKWDIQREGAEKEYLDFREEQREPVRDPIVDDDQIHYDQHGVDAQSDWFREMERAGDWDGIARFLGPLWTWSVDMIGQQVGGSPGDPMTGVPPTPPTPPCLQEHLVRQWVGLLQQAGYQVPNAPPPPPPPPPQIDPVSGEPLPPQLPPLELPPEAMAVLKWKAHMAEHKWYGEAKQRQAMQTPVLAAPGSPDETAAGNVTTEGAPPEVAEGAPV